MTHAELGRLIRRATRGMRVKPRRLYGLADYEESDDDYLGNNRFIAVALLDALANRSRKRKGDRLHAAGVSNHENEA